MCRCCQDCWEDFYWNCFEEKFCYDESIANYNPDEDEDYVAAQKNGSALGRIQSSDNNNLSMPAPICAQPLRRGSSITSNAKIHEEDYRRETQTNVPMLGPEILAVFASSQIFQDHQPTKLNRISTKTFLAGVHSPHRDLSTMHRETDEDRLLKRLEGPADDDSTDSTQPRSGLAATSRQAAEPSPEKRITFTLAEDSSPEGSQTITPKKFDPIAEEDARDGGDGDGDGDGQSETHSQGRAASERDNDEVILRPRLIDRHPHLMLHPSAAPKKQLRSAKSVPYFNVRSAASETDIFAITGSGGQISMTPEVPSISFSNLPKNYEDTPTIEKYRVSQSLYSIQTANAARATQDDYSMPRYFRRSAMLTQSSEVLDGTASGSAPGSASALGAVSPSSSKEEVRRPEKEKSKRLQMLRGTLPPLLIHSVSFRKNRDESKQVD